MGPRRLRDEGVGRETEGRMSKSGERKGEVEKGVRVMKQEL